MYSIERHEATIGILRGNKANKDRDESYSNVGIEIKPHLNPVERRLIARWLDGNKPAFGIVFEQMTHEKHASRYGLQAPVDATNEILVRIRTLGAYMNAALDTGDGGLDIYEEVYNVD